MLRHFGLLSSILFLAATGTLHANELASITLSLSVSIEPEVFESPEPGSTFASLTCADALNSVNYQGQNQRQNKCQDDNTLYSWQRSSDDLLLTIAPI
ncbi:MAG: hypothetical protein WD002_11840 [Pseudomonadales bacterium]